MYTQNMKQKLQAVVPCFLDPMLCQLFFRNYAKYKHKHIDRLIILTSAHTSTYVIGLPPGNKSVPPVGFIEKLYAKQIQDLKDLLKELGINNYFLISDIPPNIQHGRVFSYALEYINDPEYHTFFDEQDSYWVNDNFEAVAEQLSEYDLIGGFKAELPHLGTAEKVENFNKRYGTNHRRNEIPIVHLPQFLSNRAIQSLEKFDGDAYGHCDISKHIDVPENEQHIFSLDTFQILNLEVCKRTDKIKTYDRFIDYHLEPSWDIAQGILHKGPHINYGEYLLFHSVGCRMTAFSGMWNAQLSLADFKQHNFLDYFHSSFGWDLRACFHYQSLKYFPNFEYIEAYERNFRLLTQAYVEYFGEDMAPCKNGQYFSNHDCKKLLDYIL